MEGKLGTSWINNLSKAEAISYCERFGLPSSGTLDQLRAALREYCKSLSPEETPTFSSPLEENVVADLVRRLTDINSREKQSFDALGWAKLANRKELSFSGEEAESVASFLDACDEFQTDFEASDSIMYSLSSEILKGKALQWLRVNRSSLGTFSVLKERLREAYLPGDYDIRLRKDMFVRTQGPGERINDFVTCLSAMNRRLRRPLQEGELVELAYGNLHPDYLGQISPNSISSMRDLMLFGRSVEELRIRRELYMPPPKPVDMVDSEFGFSRDKSVKTGSVFTSKPIFAEEQPTPAMKCWNCDTVGHLFRNCKKSFAKFCHRCGKKGQTLHSCGCSGNAGAAP